MDPYPNLSYTYLRLDEATLAGVPDDELVECVAFSLFRMMGRERIENMNRWLPLIPRPYRAIYAVWKLKGEVHNGGFNQYFWNTDGEQIEAARDGLTLIGSDQVKRVFEKAVELYEQNRTVLRRVKNVARRLLEKGFMRRASDLFAKSYKQDDLETLDSEFYKVDSELECCLVAFIRKNSAYFVLDQNSLAKML